MNRLFTLCLSSFLLLIFQVSAQTLNQPANWPNAGWTLSGSYTAGGLSSDPTGSGATFTFDDDAAGNGSSDNLTLTSPVIDLTAASGAGETWITVSGNFTYYALGGDFLGIEAYDADAMTWSQIDQFVGNTTTVSDYQNCTVSEAYTSQVIDISGFTATQLSGFQYRFRYDDQGGWQYGFCVESPTISSSAPPSCLDPTALTATSITDTSASLGWTESGTATVWDVEIVTQGTPSTGTPTATGVSNPYAATGLSAETDYDFYVRADCGGVGTSNWVGPFSFRTNCAPIDAAYVEDFETFTPSSGSPFDNENCWNATNTGPSYFWESALGTDTSSGGTGPDPSITTGNYFFIEASGSSVSDVAELNGPLVNLSPLTSPSLTFDYHMFGGQIGTLEVVVNGTTTEWTLSGEQQTSATEPWETAIVDLSSYSGQSIVVTFRATGAGTFEGDIAIDNVAFDELPACPDPSSLMASNIADTTADLGWTENGTAAVWDVEIVDITASGVVSGTPTATGVSNPYAATGLTQNNDYEFYVRADCGSGTVSDWAGPFSFSTLETCPAPSALTASNITETGADLGWTENGAATVWNIELVDVTAGGSVTGTATETGVSTNPYSISGLSGDNSYEFYVQADCGGDGTSAWSGPFAFSTPYVAVPPSCSNGVFLDSGGRSGNYSISENITYTICPDNPGEIVSIDFSSFSTENNGASACYDGLTIYNGADNTAPTINPPGGGSIWCWDRNDTPAVGTGDLQGMTITSTDPSGCITFVFTSDGSVVRPGWEAVVSCIPAPSCTAPSALTASNVTATSADLGWTVGGSETLWDIEWGIDGFTQGSGTSIDNTTDNPYPLTGLMPETAYEFYVRADCGGSESSWAGPFDFTTPCEVVTPVYDVDFSTFLPDCWEEAGDGDASTGPSNLGGGAWSQSGTLARVNLFSSGKSEWLLTPEFDLSGGPWQMVLEISGSDFSGGGFSGMGSDDSVEVLVSTDQGSSWSVIYTFNASSPIPSSAIDVSVDLSSNTSASNLFGIRASEGTSNDAEDYYVNVHSFEINTPPSCPAPTMLMVTNIAASSADLGWTAGDSETIWDIEWGVDGFTQGAGTMINDTSDNPYTLSGLTANTAYEFYVRADCGGGDESTWAGPFDFTTSPNAIALPINESFESGLTVFDNAPGNSTDWVVNTSYFKVGSQSLSNAHGSSNTNTLLQTSVFDLSSTPDAVLQFWHIAKLEGGFDKGFVEVSTDGGATYSPLPASAYLGHSDDYDTEGYFHEDSYEIWGTSNTSPDNATWWKRETFDLSAYSSSTMRIRFRLNSDTSVNRAGWFIDDITVKEAYVYGAGSWNTSPVGLSNSTSTVIIEDGTAMPSGAFTTGDLLILPGATLNNNNGSVSVTSFMDNSGQVRGGNRLIMSGSSSSEIVGDGLISNLEINNSNGVVLNGDQGMIGRLFLQSGVLTTNDRLTFTSNTNTTAVVAAHNPVVSSISGNVTVERFIPASNRAYRFLTSSVSGQSVFDAWQESGNNANGFGTQITGTTGTTGTVNPTTGHDETISGNPSMFTYDASTNSWSPVSDTRAETLNAGTFYRLLVRGNRTNDLSTNTGAVTDVTLRSNGTLTEGTVTFNGTGTGNYLGIGNPYQSQVDMNATIRNSIAADMYYYDPTLGTQGAYTYVEIATGANTNGTSSNAANILHPGQAVFVLESGASASVQFDENDKTTTFVSNIGIFSNPTNAAYLNLRLLGVPSGASTPNNLDGLMMKFDATENLALDFDDARKWQNLDENLAIDKGNNELLAIERRPQPIADEIVNLSLSQYRNTDYQFEVTLDLLPGLKAYINDTFTNTMTEIIQGGASTTTTYSFTVDPNNPQSVATDRFQLVFETVTLGIGQDNVGSISIYPNPVTADELTIALGSNMSGQDVQVNVYNSVGQLIRSISENTGSSSMITISGMDDMANGIYFVSLKGENLEHTEKIVIK